MFCLCKHEDFRFIVFDKNTFNPEELNLPEPKIISKEEVQDEYKTVPILHLNEFLLKTMGSKARIPSTILGENGINSYLELSIENNLISNKQSNKSSNIRKLIQTRFDEINNL